MKLFIDADFSFLPAASLSSFSRCSGARVRTTRAVFHGADVSFWGEGGLGFGVRKFEGRENGGVLSNGIAVSMGV